MTDNTKTIPVGLDVRAHQRAAAEALRNRMTRQGTFIVRLLSSPGAGKTTLLAETARRLGQDHSLAIIVGDIETERDAQRLAPFAPTRQITTGGACHLELSLVERSLTEFVTDRVDFLFIEDIGNLICPASHDLGEHLRVVVLSTTEGDDKPGKYPKAFRTSQVALISKLDLLPYVPFSVEQARRDAALVQGKLAIYPVSALTGEGMPAWIELLIARRHAMLTSTILAKGCHA